MPHLFDLWGESREKRLYFVYHIFTRTIFHATYSSDIYRSGSFSLRPAPNPVSPNVLIPDQSSCYFRLFGRKYALDRYDISILLLLFTKVYSNRGTRNNTAEEFKDLGQILTIKKFKISWKLFRVISFIFLNITIQILN